MARELQRPKPLQLKADITLIGEGVPRKLLDTATIIKTVAEVMACPGVTLDPDDIAASLGCSRAQVLHVMRTPEYSEMLRQDLLGIGLAGLHRVVKNLIDINDNPDEKTQNRIAAGRALAATYETAARMLPRHAEGKSEAAFMELLDQMRKVQVDIKDTENEREGDNGDHQSPTSEGTPPDAGEEVPLQQRGVEGAPRHP